MGRRRNRPIQLLQGSNPLFLPQNRSSTQYSPDALPCLYSRTPVCSAAPPSPAAGPSASPGNRRALPHLHLRQLALHSAPIYPFPHQRKRRKKRETEGRDGLGGGIGGTRRRRHRRDSAASADSAASSRQRRAMSKVGLRSWFTTTLDSVNAILVEHQMSIELLRDAMEQDSYADQLQPQALLEVRIVLDEACTALGDAFSRLTAAHDLIDPTRRLVPPDGAIKRAKTPIADGIYHVQLLQELLKRLNANVRGMAVLFTSETTRVGLVAGQVAVARDLVTPILQRWGWALQCVGNARDNLN